MVDSEFKFITYREAEATRVKTSLEALKATQQVLRGHLGLEFDFTSPERVFFAPSTTIEKEDQKQVAAANPITRAILDADLPIPTPTFIGTSAAIKVEDQGSPRYLVSSTVGTNFVGVLPHNLQSREQLSFGSIFLFRNLASVAIRDQLEPIEVSRQQDILIRLREDLMKSIKYYAKGEYRKTVLDIAGRIGKEMEDISRLSVVGTGADIALCIDGAPTLMIQGPTIDAISLILQKIEPEFLETMNSRTSWFVHPNRWQYAENDVSIEYEDLMQKMREVYPLWNLPESARDLLQVLRFGELARLVLLDVANAKGLILTEEARPETYKEAADESSTAETFVVEKNKDGKKRKKRAITQPVQTPERWTRKPTAIREPEIAPPTERIPIRHNAPKPLTLETAEAARLRRKSQRQAREATKREERKTRTQAERLADRTFTDEQWEIIGARLANNRVKSTFTEALNEILIDLATERNQGILIGEIFPKESSENK